MISTLNDKQIDTLLSDQCIGRIGCNDGNKTYVVPVTYVYDGEYIIGHSRPGKKIDIMRKNPVVCFQVDKVTSMASWQSAIIMGIFEELHDKDAKEAMDTLITRLRNTITSETAHPKDPEDSQERREAEGFSAIVYRIRIQEKTGRYESH
jgi:uncharacterized protein